MATLEPDVQPPARPNPALAAQAAILARPATEERRMADDTLIAVEEAIASTAKVDEAKRRAMAEHAARDPEGNLWQFGTYRGEPRRGG